MRAIPLIMALCLAALPALAQEQAAGAVLRIAGSDTLRPVLEAWAEAYAARTPGWQVEIRSDGSATAPAALAGGSADLAAMSRPMTKDEVAAVRAGRDRAPLDLTVAMDAIAVIVHPDNPVQGLTMTQVDGIFSADRACGGPPVTVWRQLAVGAADAPIVLHGRNDRSGTQATFRERALCGGTFRQDLARHADSQGVVDAVAADPFAIGYVGLGYGSGAVRPLALGTGPDRETARFFPFVVERFRDSDDPERKYAYIFDGRYPLARPLRLYIDRAEGAALPPALAGFLDFALSAEGQALVEAAGFVPLPAARAAAQAAKLDPGYRPPGSWLPWN